MRPSNSIEQPPGDALAALHEIGHWLVGAASGVVLGLLLGMIAARLMRARNLHYSWAAVALALVVLTAGPLGGRAAELGLGALGATIWNRRWHREDLEAGGDLAQIAVSRHTPIGLLGLAAQAAAQHRREHAGAGGWFRGQELILGCDRRHRPVSIPFGGPRGGAHTLLVGATGSGKTVTQGWIAVRAIERGMGAIVIDPKGDRGMREEVRRAAGEAGRRFIEWTPRGPSVYNPLAGGSDTEVADKALAGERFTEPHYLRQAQRYLGHVVRALRRSGVEVSLPMIVAHLEPSRLERLVRTLPESQAHATHDYLDSLTTRQRNDLAGVRDRLAILAESDVGAWLDPANPGAEHFDLLAAARKRAVVYFDLDADSRPLLTQMLGAAIVQDLQTTVAVLQQRPTPTLVVIDEFSAVAAEQVVRLFGRARSAGFSLVLSTQELADLRLPGRERVLEQVMGNLSTLIAHRQVVRDSGELIASLAGSLGVWKVSRQSDGRTTRRRSREGVLCADQLMSLTEGRAAVIVLSRGARACIVRVFSVTR